MSKVKIEGNASGTGTLTISAPNTNTDRSLTLPDGAGEILTDASTLSSSNLSGALPAIDGSALTGVGGGITEADFWQVSTNITANADPITNWSRSATTGFAKIGTGMSVSSGVWTFPLTGLWMIDASFYVDCTGGDYVEVRIFTSTDSGSTWSNASQSGHRYGNAVGGAGQAFNGAYLNVTDTSTVKVKFEVNDITSGSLIRGATTTNRSWARFIRLGDSQ